jgi:hypothetical protein
MKEAALGWHLRPEVGRVAEGVLPGRAEHDEEYLWRWIDASQHLAMRPVRSARRAAGLIGPKNCRGGSRRKRIDP